MIDVNKVQTIRLLVQYDGKSIKVDIPIPQIVPDKHIDTCTVLVLGLSNAEPNEGHCGWRKE